MHKSLQTRQPLQLCMSLLSRDCQTGVQHRNAEQTKTPLFYFDKVAKGLASLSFFFCLLLCIPIKISIDNEC